MRSGTGKGKRLDQSYSNDAKNLRANQVLFLSIVFQFFHPCRRLVCAARRRARLSLKCCPPCVSDSLSAAYLHRFRLFVLADRCTTTNYPVVCFLPPVRGSICSTVPKRLAVFWTVHCRKGRNSRKKNCKQPSSFCFLDS